MPATIPYVMPDNGAPVFSMAEVRYSFHQPSHTFSGQTSGVSPGDADINGGNAFIVARFNYAGELEHGHVRVVGGIPSMSIPDDTVLLKGTIVNVDNFYPEDGAIYRVNFIFRIDQDALQLGYESHFGVWNAYMNIEFGWTPSRYRYLFRRSWGPWFAPLNSYVGQIRNFF